MHVESHANFTTQEINIDMFSGEGFYGRIMLDLESAEKLSAELAVRTRAMRDFVTYLEGQDEASE